MRENGVRSLSVQCKQCRHQVVRNVDHLAGDIAVSVRAADRGFALPVGRSPALPNTECSGCLAGQRTSVRADPHAAAPRDWPTASDAENVGLTQKSIAVDQIMAQSSQDQSDAAYLRTAAKSALLAGEVGAGASLFGSVAQGLSAFTSMPACRDAHRTGGGRLPQRQAPDHEGRRSRIRHRAFFDYRCWSAGH